MAKFYGQVFGNAQTSASRTGSKASGIRSTAQHSKGSVIVEMHEDGEGVPWVTIELSCCTSSRGKQVFCGSMDELCETFTGHKMNEF